MEQLEWDVTRSLQLIKGLDSSSFKLGQDLQIAAQEYSQSRDDQQALNMAEMAIQMHSLHVNALAEANYLHDCIDYVYKQVLAELSKIKNPVWSMDKQGADKETLAITNTETRIQPRRNARKGTRKRSRRETASVPTTSGTNIKTKPLMRETTMADRENRKTTEVKLIAKIPIKISTSSRTVPQRSLRKRTTQPDELPPTGRVRATRSAVSKNSHAQTTRTTKPPVNVSNVKAIRLKQGYNTNTESDKISSTRKTRDKSQVTNEPLYCLCNDVSYGQMIACDNRKCPKEWFHLACVGLKKVPRGKWFCPLCRK